MRFQKFNNKRITRALVSTSLLVCDSPYTSGNWLVGNGGSPMRIAEIFVEKSSQCLSMMVVQGVPVRLNLAQIARERSAAPASGS